jgi:hypothetical protein
VEVDARRAARGLMGAGVVLLAAVTITLFAAGVHKNAQITSLRQNGVLIEVTVTKCLGALGGSGSNAAGYSCRGTFILNGKRYTHTIPGDTLLAPGTAVGLVTVKSDPGLIATTNQVESDHTSWRVFTLPIVLLVVLAAFIVAILVRSRRKSQTV